ncbi:hypothetical protein GCM10022207_67210 [Streptomyces lannensis]|uniref:Uncharacterized protein n=1 Tax=Streptomyces lannensis TaxID=766498 RepID=A0ABP7KYL4_9ACTN
MTPPARPAPAQDTGSAPASPPSGLEWDGSPVRPASHQVVWPPEPDVGEAQRELVDKFPGCEVPLVSVPLPCTKPDGTTGTDLYLSKDGQAAFAADLSTAAFRLLQSTRQSFDVAPFIHLAKAAAWQTIRTSPPAPHRGRRSGDPLPPRLACPCPCPTITGRRTSDSRRRR